MSRERSRSAIPELSVIKLSFVSVRRASGESGEHIDPVTYPPSTQSHISISCHGVVRLVSARITRSRKGPRWKGDMNGDTTLRMSYYTDVQTDIVPNVLNLPSIHLRSIEQPLSSPCPTWGTA